MSNEIILNETQDTHQKKFRVLLAVLEADHTMTKEQRRDALESIANLVDSAYETSCEQCGGCREGTSRPLHG